MKGASKRCSFSPLLMSAFSLERLAVAGLK